MLISEVSSSCSVLSLSISDQTAYEKLHHQMDNYTENYLDYFSIKTDKVREEINDEEKEV